MTLDVLDAAFVQRWQAGAMPPDPQPAVVAPPTAPPAAPSPPAAHVPAPVPDQPEEPPAAEPAIVARLLADAGPQWNAIADRIEAARGRGRRVIAVAGCERGEGRTTIVAAVALVLRQRGRDVLTVGPGDLATVAGPTHDKRIVLVDAGVWFPPGPIRRARLLVASHGCEAAILVRRAGRPTGPAIEASLEAIGVEPLGEVVTFAAGDVEPAAEETA